MCDHRSGHPPVYGVGECPCNITPPQKEVWVLLAVLVGGYAVLRGSQCDSGSLAGSAVSVTSCTVAGYYYVHAPNDCVRSQKCSVS